MTYLRSPILSPVASPYCTPPSAPLLATAEATDTHSIRHTEPAVSDLERSREFAFAITGAFEGGEYFSLQTTDSGIVSYGRHQATLRSGALEAIIERYVASSDRPAARGLREFLPDVRDKAPFLRSSRVFLDLLRSASSDPLMQRAQDDVFRDLYWEPAVSRAHSAGVSSPLALAIFFDTNIQGGLESVLRSTKAQLTGNSYSEQEFLGAFLENRRQFLFAAAENKREVGAQAEAAILERDAERRVGVFERLLQESASESCEM